MALSVRQITARIPHQSQKWVPKCPFLCQLPPGGSQGRSRASACKQQFSLLIYTSKKLLMVDIILPSTLASIKNSPSLA